MIRVLFFAQLRERLGTSGMDIVYEESIETVGDLLRRLFADNDPLWAEVLSASNVICAVNQQVSDMDRQLCAGDEVAFFPPVTGG
ncbi:MAG: molybdopterin synthase sulfur carrier subunit [Halieaceae bacterium]|jgi:molybdopterin synthase sulfur carrier subunit